MVGIKIKIKIFLLLFLHSCGHEYVCPQLDYKSLNIDTTQMLDNQIFISGIDSVVFKSKSYTLNKTKSNPSMFSSDECANGIYLIYESDRFNFEWNSYIITRDKSEGIEIAIFSYCIETVTYDNVKSVEAIDTTLFVNKRLCEVLEVEIENGIFIAFRDYNGKYWELVR